MAAHERELILKLHIHALRAGQRHVGDEAQIRRVRHVHHAHAVARLAVGKDDVELAIAAPQLGPVTARAAGLEHVEQHGVARVADVVGRHAGAALVGGVDEEVADDEGMADEAAGLAKMVEGRERLAIITERRVALLLVAGVAPVGRADVPRLIQIAARVNALHLRGRGADVDAGGLRAEGPRRGGRPVRTEHEVGAEEQVAMRHDRMLGDAELLDFAHVGEVREVPAAHLQIGIGLAGGRFRHGVKPAVVIRQHGGAALLRREQRRQQPAGHLRDIGETAEGDGRQRGHGERGDAAGDAAGAVREHDAKDRAGVVGGDAAEREARGVGTGQVGAVAPPLELRRRRAGGGDGERHVRPRVHGLALRLRGEGRGDGHGRVGPRCVGVRAEEGEQLGVGDLRGIREVAAGKVRGNLRAVKAEVLELGAEAGVLVRDDTGVLGEVAAGLGNREARLNSEPVRVGDETDLHGGREVRAREAPMHEPLPARVAPQRDDRAAEPGDLQFRLRGGRAGDVEGRGAVHRVLHLELIGARIVRRAHGEEDVVLLAQRPASRAGRVPRGRAHHQAGQRILAAGGGGAGAVARADLGGDDEIPAHGPEGKLADVVVIPAAGARQHGQAARARDVDVAGFELVGVPTFDRVDALVVGQRRGAVELVGQHREVVGERRHIVIVDREGGARGRAEGGAARRVAEGKVHRLRAFHGRVVGNGDGEALVSRVTGGPVQRAARRGVITARRRAAVAGGEAHAHRAAGAARASDGDRRGAGVLGDGVGRGAELERARRGDGCGRGRDGGEGVAEAQLVQRGVVLVGGRPEGDGAKEDVRPAGRAAGGGGGDGRGPAQRRVHKEVHLVRHPELNPHHEQRGDARGDGDVAAHEGEVVHAGVVDEQRPVALAAVVRGRAVVAHANAEIVHVAHVIPVRERDGELHVVVAVLPHERGEPERRAVAPDDGGIAADDGVSRKRAGHVEPAIGGEVVVAADPVVAAGQEIPGRERSGAGIAELIRVRVEAQHRPRRREAGAAALSVEKCSRRGRERLVRAERVGGRRIRRADAVQPVRQPLRGERVLSGRDGVADAGQPHEERRDAGVGQRGVELLAVRDGNLGVGLAVDEEERRRARAEVRHRIDRGERGRVARGGRAEEQREEAGGLLIRSGEADVGRAAHVRDGLHGAGLPEVFADIEEVRVTGRARERGEMTAGGIAPDADARGVEIELRGVGAEPAKGGLHVLDLRGVRDVGGIGRGELVRGEAVADGGDGDVVIREGEGAREVFIAREPAAAVEPHDDGRGGRRAGDVIEVEPLAMRAAGDVGNVVRLAVVRGERLRAGGEAEEEQRHDAEGAAVGEK